MTKATPLLSDIQSTKTKFQPGDRVIVRTASILNKDQVRKILKAVRKYTGEDVRAIIVDCTKCTVILTTPAREQWGDSDSDGYRSFVSSARKIIVGKQHAQMSSGLPGVANQSCGKVELQSGDRLDVVLNTGLDNAQHKQLRDAWREWAGEDVEVVISGIRT